MHSFLIEMLECPVCHHPLDWQIAQQRGGQIEEAEARCLGCSATYPIREGIGIFLTPDLPRNDLWEQVDSQLVGYLKEHPQLERRLMDVPLEDLSPTDLHFRALVLEERGSFSEARKAEQPANESLYTPAFLACWNSQMEYTLDSVSAMDGPVVDLASGRCYLVEQIVGRLRQPVVASDFSPSVLRRDRKLFQYLGFEDLVSLLAFDARRTPFKNSSIEIMTTNLGLPNIEEPGRLLHELHRVVGGTLLAISHFFPMLDDQNSAVIKEAGLETLLHREPALKQFDAAGWDFLMENVCLAKALPTPPSELLEGARADGLPVAPTELEWCTIRANHGAGSPAN